MRGAGLAFRVSFLSFNNGNSLPNGILMPEKVIINPASDHVRQWAAMKQTYVAKRGSDAGRNRKAIPRTTNADIRQLANYWHGEYLRELLTNPKALDKDLASRKRWNRQQTEARPPAGQSRHRNALYAENEWFWQEASRRIAIYLESRKAIPARAELFVDAVSETVSEQVEAVKDAAEKAGKDAWEAIKTGALILGGLTAAAIVIPPIIRGVERLNFHDQWNNPARDSSIRPNQKERIKMTPADESFAQFFGIDPKHRDVLVHWCNDVFVGVELSLFGGLIGGLLFQTDATADSIASSFPQKLDALPWRGSEQRLAEVLVADLRERGQSDEQIAEIAQVRSPSS